MDHKRKMDINKTELVTCKKKKIEKQNKIRRPTRDKRFKICITGLEFELGRVFFIKTWNN